MRIRLWPRFLAAGEQPPEGLHAVDLLRRRLVETALRLVGAVAAAPWALRGQVVQVGEGADEVVRVDVCQSEGADAGGVDDPAVPGQGQHHRAGRGVPAPAG